MNGTTVSQVVADAGIWPLIVMLLPYLFLFRKHGAEANRKRLASLLQAIAVFLVTTAAATVMSFGLSDLYLLIAVVIVAVGAYLARAWVFPYQSSCPQCGKKYNLFSEDIKIVYVMDDNLCDDCRPAEA